MLAWWVVQAKRGWVPFSAIDCVAVCAADLARDRAIQGACREGGTKGLALMRQVWSCLVRHGKQAVV